MKEWTNRYNSFNSLKALVHVKYWEQIKKGIIPPPVFLSIDPFGGCNLGCHHCNVVESAMTGASLSKEQIDKIVSIINVWDTKALCIAGGGEPLIYKNTYYLINKLTDNNRASAVITNGTSILDKEALLKCAYIGISVDASTNKTWQAVKGTQHYTIDTVFKNIEKITRTGTEITYKFLLLPQNYHEVYTACKRAKEIGCNQFHLRPGGLPWFGGNKELFTYNSTQINMVVAQIEEARHLLEDNTFKIYGVTHKFSDSWQVKNNFKKCYALYTTGYFSSNGRFGLCCDRRDDSDLMLGTIEEIAELWGGEKHKRMHSTLNIKTCPRCTYSVINEIFEHVIMKDEMLCDFF